MELRGNYLYVGETNCLEAVRVSGAGLPKVTRRLGTPSAGLAVNGQLLFSGVGINSGQINVYSLGNPARPTLRGAVTRRLPAALSVRAPTSPVAGVRRR